MSHVTAAIIFTFISPLLSLRHSLSLSLSLFVLFYFLRIICQRHVISVCFLLLLYLFHLKLINNLNNFNCKVKKEKKERIKKRNRNWKGSLKRFWFLFSFKTLNGRTLSIRIIKLFFFYYNNLLAFVYLCDK